jgi:RND family efflux transporter MFP subunit
MNLLLSIAKDFIRFFSIKTTWGRVRFLLLVLVVVAAGLLLRGSETEITETLEFVGTVRTRNEADVQAEVGGQVTRVNVVLGQTIVPGTVIATLENASEYASLLQAEGAYEAALASAAVSGVGLTEAKVGLNSATEQGLSAAESAYAIVFGIVSNELDTLVADENNVYQTGGVVLRDQAASLRLIESTYDSLGMTLPLLRTAVNSATDDSDALAAIAEAQARVADAEVIVNEIRSMIVDDDADESYDADEAAMLSTLSSLNSQLASARSALRSATTQINVAREVLSRAELSATFGEVSVSDAQVKQALGALRAAEANYNKTILRSPIGGAIADLSVSNGDYVGVGTTIARIINNGAYEVVLFASESERSALTPGTEVNFTNGATGTISVVAPGVSGTVGKTEFRVVSNSPVLIAGQSVRVQVPVNDLSEVSSETGTTTVTLPLTAIKFQVEQGFVFTVTDENVLVAHEVALGAVSAGRVEVNRGLAPGMRIVTDARGLSAGQQVNVIE